MSVLTASPIPAPPDVSAGRPLHLAVETTGSGDVIVRALVLLRRRGCRIVAVDFLAADRHGPGRFEVCLEAPPRTEHRVEAWLRGLVDVVAVRSGAG
jgi:hypothetical protein